MKSKALHSQVAHVRAALGVFSVVRVVGVEMVEPAGVAVLVRSPPRQHPKAAHEVAQKAHHGDDAQHPHYRLGVAVLHEVLDAAFEGKTNTPRIGKRKIA